MTSFSIGPKLVKIILEYKTCFPTINFANQPMFQTRLFQTFWSSPKIWTYQKQFSDQLKHGKSTGLKTFQTFWTIFVKTEHSPKGGRFG